MRRKILISLSCFILMLSASAFSYAATGYYNTYETVASLKNSDFSNCQGLAVGSTYAYSAKINSAQTQAVLYRTTMSSGATTQLTNGDNSKKYATYMGKANDMDVCTLDGKSHLFITTMTAASNNLIKVKIDGTKFYKVGQFTFKHDGVAKNIAGLSILSKTSSQITFLCKSGTTFFTGTIELKQNSGDINLTQKFIIDVANASVNGSKVANLGAFNHQGMEYSAGNLYVPLSGNTTIANKPNVSVVLVYRNISGSTTSTAERPIQADPYTSFRITSSTYSKMFEIESCGICSGKLWFNTNRQTKDGVGDDGVHYFKGYTQQ